MEQQQQAQRRNFIILAALAAICVWSVLASLTNAAAFNYYCNDDAYISFTYAKNLLHGNGLVFNPGERVEGYTNFLWLMFLVPWMRLLPGTDISLIAIAWGAVFSVCVLALTYYLGYLHQQRHGWRSLIAPALLSFDNTFHYWSISGLENAFQATLVLAAFAFLLHENGPRKAPLYSGFLFALATMARPDSGLFWAVSLAALSLRAARSRSTFAGPLLLAGGFFAIAIPYCAWKLSYYGNILPNTFYLHTGDRMLRVARGESYFLRFLWNRLCIPLICLVAAFSGYSFRRALLLMSVISYACYVIWMGGDFFPGSRFFYILLPFIYLLIQDALDVSTRFWQSSKMRLAAAVLTAILCAGIFYGSYGAAGEYRNFVLVWAEDDARRIQLAKDLGSLKQEGDSILSGPIGQIGYYSGMRVLDYWGVIDPHIARLKLQDTGGGTPGHEKTDFAYLLDRKPTYILFGVDPNHPPSGYVFETLSVENRRWKVLKRNP